mmetsp:Transcript_44014/g.116389  ORF Transcript_44014/g.116389 Transcript_44014/m.116389 type:complete len:244 (+) Transcript_44014:3414-4145(+)
MVAQGPIASVGTSSSSTNTIFDTVPEATNTATPLSPRDIGLTPRWSSSAPSACKTDRPGKITHRSRFLVMVSRQDWDNSRIKALSMKGAACWPVATSLPEEYSFGAQVIPGLSARGMRSRASSSCASCTLYGKCSGPIVIVWGFRSGKASLKARPSAWIPSPRVGCERTTAPLSKQYDADLVATANSCTSTSLPLPWTDWAATWNSGGSPFATDSRALVRTTPLSFQVNRSRRLCRSMENGRS